jgi:hypothetical protein
MEMRSFSVAIAGHCIQKIAVGNKNRLRVFSCFRRLPGFEPSSQAGITPLGLTMYSQPAFTYYKSLRRQKLARELFSTAELPPHNGGEGWIRTSDLSIYS